MPASPFLLFDCDGVLIDSEILATRVSLRKLADFGYAATEHAHSQRFAGMMDTAILRILSQELNTLWPEDFYDDLQSSMQQAFKEELAAIPGMPELLASLSIPKAVVSNSSMHHVQTSLLATGMYGFFEERMFSSQQVQHPKPAPDLYLLALQTLGLTPAQTLVVEDSPSGVTAAKAAGLEVVGFLGASHIFEGHDQKLLEAGADHLATDASSLEALIRNWAQRI
jgi:HAD superfamily hydrolase (TIGR01509 family)